MRLPIPYNPSCNQKKDALFKTTVDKQQNEEQWVTKIKENFDKSLDYTLVNKNLDYSKTYDSWIYQGNKTDKVLGSYKEFLSYPYQPRQFDIGDYVSFDYGGDIHDWLITSLDKKLYYDVHGRIERCNIRLKWQDDYGNIYDYPAIAKEQWSADKPDYDNAIIINQGKLSITVQYNEFTKYIPINKRFLIGDPYQAVKVVALVNYTDTNTLGLEVVIDNKSSSDNEALGIANYNSHRYSINIVESDFSQQIGFNTQLHYEVKLNGIITSDSVKWSSSDVDIANIDQDGNIQLLSEGNVTFTCEMLENSLVSDSIAVSVVEIPIIQKEVIISPTLENLLQETEQIYGVYLFENGIQQSDIFTFTPQDVPVSNYQFDILDGNMFKVKNIQMYIANPLKISCVSGVYSKDIYINLKGLW